ncbi:M23 family metallopeptidase [Ureibacillus aquaedulcis]|uniref:M23 family metallopeptidase n=1 Tax=Ureibacillus aquaedulcis TaxID=3058421 RepID=A0ABT8GRU0_9BACL|nr:M23 family metallopeptidase [Ureibacillus sp. BA0131]MDN4494130.1 M23 family metallopeptidase [Ureibacillus sp. BA0131]
MSSKWNISGDFTKKQSISLNFKPSHIFRKAAMATLLFTAMSSTNAFADETSASGIEKIYHVYVGDTYIGAVSNEEAVTEIIQTKEQEVQKLYQDYNLDGGSNVTLIPEQVFSYETDDAATLSKLKEENIVEADSYAIQIDGKPVVYLKDQADFNKTMRLLKLQYVTEAELQKYEANASLEKLPALEAKETRIKEIKVVEAVSGQETKVNPDQIVTPAEAVEYLKTGSLEKETYAVQSGDVLGTIASAHNLSTAQILELNPGLTEDSLLQIDQEINVTVEKPLVNVEVVKEKNAITEIPFEKIVEEDDSMFKGETVVKQEGSKGKKEVSYLISQVNGAVVEKTVTKETVLAEPVDSVTVVGIKVISSRGTGSFAWPAVGGYISSQMGSRWGSYHRGIDIARPSNYDIKASDNGVVTATGWDGTYGQRIIIDHNNGYQTIYAHLSEIDVSVGQVVPQGAVIGIMGSTGRSTGTHLHFEMHKNGALVNPLSYLNY